MCCGMLLLVMLAGCNAKSGLDGDTKEPEQPPPNTENGIATRILDATKTEEWVYFNLASNAVVYPADATNSRDWDIAFQRFKIKLNSGVSGNGGAQVAVLKKTTFDAVQSLPAGLEYHSDRALSELSDSELIALDAGQFFAVCAPGFTCINAAAGTVDRAHLNTDIAAYAMLTFGSGVMYEGGTQRPILGWYNYLFDEQHRLEPAGDTWLIKTVDGIDIKLNMLGYYGQGSSEAGTMAFKYQSLTPGFTVPAAGAEQFKVALEASTLQGIAPLAVDFSTQATGGTPAQWQWDFGDNTTSIEMTPAHTYQQAGTYVAKVTVTDQRGARSLQSVTIIVSAPGQQPPVANAGPDQSIMLGMGVTQTQVTLNGRGSTDDDGEIVSYVWAGSPKPSDDPEPVVVLGIGRYAFTLTITDDQGLTASDTVEITVASPDNDPPTAHIAATPTLGVAPLPVQFSGTGSSDTGGGMIVSYHWDFGDGNTSSAVAPLHTYTQSGHYTATLTVTDDGGAVAATTAVIDAMLVVTPSADTFLYQFNIIGNMPGLDILQVWNHESDHGGRILMDFDDLDAKLASLSAGNFTATMKMYTVCDTNGGGGSLAESCPGADRAASPDQKAAVTTDICLMDSSHSISWTENGAFHWADIADGAPCVNFTVNTTEQWISVDVTALVEAWRSNGSTDKGLVFTQEAYPVTRDDDNHAVVLGIYSRRHVAPDNRQPSLEIRINH
jgi:PKD repeat protein